jgi:DNA repair exonuclease SbcCD nuclease subunit
MSSPVAVILTDTHLTKNNQELVESIFEQAIELAFDWGVPIIHAGDWFTNRIGQNLSTLVSMQRTVESLERNQIICYTIAGNHDKTDQDSNESYVSLFSSDNLVVFDDEATITLGDEGEQLLVGFLPFFTKSYIERLRNIEKAAEGTKKADRVLITHKAFNGVRNNDGSEVEDGVSPSEVKFWNKVLVGHYHDASKVGKNIHYIGSAYQGNFGENITDKGFTILSSDCSLELVNSEFPKYKKIVLDADDEDSIENELEVHANSEDNIRFVFRGKKTDLDRINLSKFTDAGIDCKFESDEVNEEILNVEGSGFQMLDKKSISKHFIKYCKIQGIESNQMKKGLKILRDDAN